MKFLLLLFLLPPCTVSWALSDGYPCGRGPWIDMVACQDHYRLVQIDTQIGTIDLAMPIGRSRGETVSTKVTFTPAGSTEDARRKNQAEFEAGYLDSFGFGDRIPASSSVAVWKVSLYSSSQGTVCFDYADEAKRNFSTDDRNGCKDITKPSGSWFNETLPLPPERPFQTDSLHLASMPVRIAGSFSGNLSNTSVQIDDHPAVILAESEAEVLVTPTSDLGLHKLAVNEGGKDVLRTYVRFFDMDITPEMVPKPGETVPVTLTLTGFTNLTDSIRISLTASSFAFQSARISKLDAGCASVGSHTSGLFRRAQRITLTIPSRGCAKTDGAYIARFLATGTKDRHLSTALGEVWQGRAWAPAPTAFDVQISVPLSDENRARTIGNSIRQWSADNAIPVSLEAVKAIQAQFADTRNRSLEEELWGALEAQEPDESAFLDSLVRYYLYDLRDGYPVKSSAHSEEPAIGNGFLSRDESDHQKAINEKTDGDSRLLNLVLGVWWRIAKDSAILEIDSDPPHLRVSWTGGGGAPDRDETNRTWHFPPGSYTISIGPNPDLRFKFVPQCPGPHGTVTCSKDGCKSAINERCEDWVRATQSLKAN